MGDLLVGMKALATFLALFVSLNLSFAQKNPNLDDPKVQDAIIAEAIDGEKLQWRGKEELAYAPNQKTPFSGWTKRMYDTRMRSDSDGVLSNSNAIAVINIPNARYDRIAPNRFTRLSQMLKKTVP